MVNYKGGYIFPPQKSKQARKQGYLWGKIPYVYLAGKITGQNGKMIGEKFPVSWEKIPPQKSKLTEA
jgi:hypothetical protein